MRAIAMICFAIKISAVQRRVDVDDDNVGSNDVVDNDVVLFLKSGSRTSLNNLRDLQIRLRRT